MKWLDTYSQPIRIGLATMTGLFISLCNGAVKLPYDSNPSVLPEGKRIIRHVDRLPESIRSYANHDPDKGVGYSIILRDRPKPSDILQFRLSSDNGRESCELYLGDRTFFDQECNGSVDQYIITDRPLRRDIRFTRSKKPSEEIWRDDGAYVGQVGLASTSEELTGLERVYAGFLEDLGLLEDQ